MLEVRGANSKPMRRMLKRVMDIAGSMIGLMLFAPILIVIAIYLLVKQGPPLFHRDRRLGLHGCTFDLVKFRTLRKGTGGQRSVAPEDDDRITPAGLWLRRWRLDELPQFVNVLRGDMSLVGPRPISPMHARALNDEVLNELLGVRPGITDPGTVRFLAEDAVLAGHSDPDSIYLTRILPAKAAAQLEYIRAWGLLADLRTLLRTVSVLWSAKYRRQSAEYIRQLLE